MITLKIRWRKKEFDLEVYPRYDTVMDLKRKLYKATNVLPEDQTISVQPNKKKKKDQKKDEKKELLKDNSTLLFKIGLDTDTTLDLFGDVREEEQDKYSQRIVSIDILKVGIDRKKNWETNFANQHKLQRLLKDSEIQANPRKRKKSLLVIDGDYVIFGNQKRMDSNYKKALGLLLRELYQVYDIMIWTSHSLNWIKTKMKFLGIPGTNYQIAAVLDLSLMMSVSSSSSVLECRPLKVIWDKYPQYHEKRTVMLDCLEASFAMNLKNGLHIEPLNQLGVNEHNQLQKYLIKVASAEENEDFIHNNWLSCSTSWIKWDDYVNKSYEVGPFIFIDSLLNETEAECHLGCQKKCHDSCGKVYTISRMDECYRPFIHSLSDSWDPNLLKVHHLSRDQGAKKIFLVGESREAFSVWMPKNRPLDGDDKLDTNKFATPFRSLLNSTISAIIATKYVDFKLTIDDVCVVERDGQMRLAVGLVKVEKRNGPLKCLKGLADIVDKWFKRHKCEMPYIVSELLQVLDNWNLDTFQNETQRRRALRMLCRHPAFFPANKKPIFDDIIKLDSETKNNTYQGNFGNELIKAFHSLGYKHVKNATPWYLPGKADALIKSSVQRGKAPPGNEIEFLVKDLRNLASHLHENRKLTGQSGGAAEAYNQCFDSVDAMLQGTFSAIHLCIINMGLSYLFVKD